ncbi:hypothetical protein TIFTF001_017445 [Ficus carica]|uniref:Pentatricopeptide repeat-containing protein n=1 Tax=Ficus carica TaxID=3494 RepID=A0AA88AL69_FICCA|nr:hypothetical protein TIFTF001_017445 [Ficus carica]
MPANVRNVHSIAQIHYHRLKSSQGLTSHTFDFLNQFLPFAGPNSVSSDSVNSNERRQIAVGLTKIVKSEKNYVLKGFSREFRPCFLVNIMKLLGTRETAFAFFKVAFRDDSDRIVESCCVAAQILAAEDLQFLAQDMVSFVIGIIGASRSRNLVEFMWKYHSFYESDFSVLNTLMRSFLNAEMGSEALEIVSKMREVGVSPTSSASRILLKLLLRVGDYGSVWKFFKDIVRKGPFPTTHTFNMMILGFCRKGLLGIGESLLHVMRKFRCEPDVFTYNIVINANCMRGETSNALEWIHFMIWSGCEPNVVTFNVVINALSKEGEMVKARRFFDGILDLGIFPNTITYNIMIDGYVKAGDLVEAGKLYEDMRYKGISPDGMTFNILIGVLIDGYFRMGDHKGARSLWKEMHRGGIFPDAVAFAVFINGLARVGLMDAYDMLLEAARERFVPSYLSYDSLIRWFYNYGKLNRKLMFGREMRQKGFSSGYLCDQYHHSSFHNRRMNLDIL